MKSTDVVCLPLIMCDGCPTNHPSNQVACQSSHFYVYDAEAMELTDWSKDNSNALPQKWLTMNPRIAGIAFSAAHPNKVFLCSYKHVCMVDLEYSPTESLTADTDQWFKVFTHPLIFCLVLDAILVCLLYVFFLFVLIKC